MWPASQDNCPPLAYDKQMFTPPKLFQVIWLEYSQASASKSPTTNNDHTTTEFFDCNKAKKSKSNLLLLRMIGSPKIC